MGSGPFLSIEVGRSGLSNAPEGSHGHNGSFGPVHNPTKRLHSCPVDVVLVLTSHPDLTNPSTPPYFKSKGNQCHLVVSTPWSMHMPLTPGTVLADTYLVGKTVPSGPFSEVYLGTTVDLAHRVAIKVLRDTVTNQLSAASFQKELQSLRLVVHPNVVRLDFSGETSEGFPFLVTEFLPKPLVPIGKWDAIKAVELCHALLSALQRAHAEGVIHRDLKPQHVLLDDSGTPKIIDFGIANIRRMIPKGVTLAQLHTPGYACPEQVSGLAAKPHFDLYALSALMYWYLTGYDPPPDADLAQSLSALLTVPVQFRDLLLDLAVGQRSGTTAGTALRELERLSQHWVKTEEVNLIIDRPDRERLTQKLGLGLDDAVALLSLLQHDLEPLETQFPALAVEQHAIDIVAWMAHQYRLVGFQYVWRLRPHIGGRAFSVVDVMILDAAQLEGHRQTGSEYPIDWYPVTFGERLPDNAVPIRALCERVITDELSRSRSRAAVDQRFNLVETWEKVFGLRRQLLDDPAASVEYVAWHQQEGLLHIDVDSVSALPNLWGGEERLSMTPAAQPAWFIPVGQLVGRDRARLLVKPDPALDIATLAAKGRIGADRSLDYAALKRQQEALVRIREGSTVNQQLPAILCATEDPQPMDVAVIDSWFNPQLDARKKEAVRKALATKDILLVQGPPGTGKTIAIAEMVLQILAKHPRAKVLVVSQSHVAVDQALERVRRQRPDAPLARLVV